MQRGQSLPASLGQVLSVRPLLPFAFPGLTPSFFPVSVGTTPGSPVSPLLFVIYVSPLHIPVPRGLVLSYLDDFSVTTSSPSCRCKSRALRSIFGHLRAIAHTSRVDFSVPKTDLIHWLTPVQRDPCSASRPPPVALDGQLFHPFPKLRWLGYWFVPNLASSAHFSRHLALSQAAFAAVRRLSAYGLGVCPHLGHRLAFSVLFPILGYGADLFVPSKGLLSKMEVNWRKVQHWVKNYFVATPIPILSAEASLPPLAVLLPHKRGMATFRLGWSPRQINPASARLCRAFPSLLIFRAPDSHRSVCTRLDPNIMPLNWKTPRPSPPTRTHLPVDAMAHLTLSLIRGRSFAPLINSSVVLDLAPLRPDNVMKATYSSLKASARLLILDSWPLDHPPPPYYCFHLSLTPHPFMGPGKFIAGRIHQMRAQKSDLAAHPYWSSPEALRFCPFCGEEQETFSHAVPRCPAKAAARSCQLQGFTSVSPDAPIWSTVSLHSSLSAYVKATTTNHGPDMFPSLPPSPASMVFLSAPASPLPVGLLFSSPPRPV